MVGKPAPEKLCSCSNGVTIEQPEPGGPYLIDEKAVVRIPIESMEIIQCNDCNWNTLVLHGVSSSYSLPLGFNFEKAKAAHSHEEFQCNQCSEKERYNK